MGEDELVRQAQRTLENAIFQQTVTEAIGMLKAAQTLSGAQFPPPPGEPQVSMGDRSMIG